MKQFNLSELNQDKNTYTGLKFSFNKVDGLKITTSKEIVSKRPQTIPASGCDFISLTGSTSSKHFFEVSEMPEINTLFFSKDYGFSFNGFVYCLNENKEDVLKIVNLELSKFIHVQIKSLLSDVQQLADRFDEIEF